MKFCVPGNKKCKSIKIIAMSQKTYDEFSQDYDRFVNWQARLSAELPFIEAQIATHKRDQATPITVLDAACGSGGHAIALAKNGYAVAGTDLSPGMITQARKNAQKEGLTIDFQAAGFGTLQAHLNHSPLFPFNAIICLGNSLPHLLSTDEISQALKDFYNCLKPGGVLILQNRNFDAVMAKKERWIGPQARRIDDEEWLFLRFYDFDPDGLITFNIVRLHRQGGGDWQQHISVTRLYPLLYRDLIERLSQAGFGDVNAFGLMDHVPFDPAHSENLVIAARKSA